MSGLCAHAAVSGRTVTARVNMLHCAAFHAHIAGSDSIEACKRCTPYTLCKVGGRLYDLARSVNATLADELWWNADKKGGDTNTS